MNQKQSKRYLEIKKAIEVARNKKSIGRETNNRELILDAESSLDFLNGCQSELVRWFGNFPRE